MACANRLWVYLVPADAMFCGRRVSAEAVLAVMIGLESQAASGIGRQPAQRGDQKVDLGPRVVHGQGRPDGRLQPVPAQYRLGTVMTGPHRDTLRVQRGGDFLGPVAVEDEREDARLVGGRADEADAWHGADLPGRVLKQLVLVLLHDRQAERADVIQRGAEPYRIRDVAGASLESGRRCLVAGPLQGDVGDHVPAALPWRRLGQGLWLAVEHP